MAKTVVKGPDGKRYTVTHPDGASQDEIIAYAKKMAVPEAPAQQPGDPTKPGQYVAGQMLPGVIRGGKEIVRNLQANLPSIATAASKILEPITGRSDALIDPETPQEAQAWQQQQQANPIASEAGRMASRLAPYAITGPAGLAGQVGTGLGLAALEENPTTAAAWNMLGPAVGFGAKHYKQIKNALSGNLEKVTDVAPQVKGSNLLQGMVNKGYIVDPAMASGAEGLPKVAIAAAEGHPITKNIFSKVAEHNQKLFNDSVAKSMGTQVTNFSNDGLTQIKAELSKRYDDVIDLVDKWRQASSTVTGKPVGIDLPINFADQLKAVSPDLYKKVKSEVDSGVINGETFKYIRSQIGQLTTGKKPKNTRARELIERLDVTIESQVPKSVIKQYRQVREQFRNYFAVEGLTSQRARTAAGDVDPVALQTRLRKSYKPGSKPNNPETTSLIDDADAIATTRHDKAPSGFVFARDLELREALSPLEYVGRAFPALAGASRMGTKEPEIGGEIARVVRALTSPTMREKTPYYPSMLAPQEER